MRSCRSPVLTPPGCVPSPVRCLPCPAPPASARPSPPCAHMLVCHVHSALFFSLTLARAAVAISRMHAHTCMINTQHTFPHTFECLACSHHSPPVRGHKRRPAREERGRATGTRARTPRPLPTTLLLLLLLLLAPLLAPLLGPPPLPLFLPLSVRPGWHRGARHCCRLPPRIAPCTRQHKLSSRRLQPFAAHADAPWKEGRGRRDWGRPLPRMGAEEFDVLVHERAHMYGQCRHDSLPGALRQAHHTAQQPAYVPLYPRSPATCLPCACLLSSTTAHEASRQTDHACMCVYVCMRVYVHVRRARAWRCVSIFACEHLCMRALSAWH